MAALVVAAAFSLILAFAWRAPPYRSRAGRLMVTFAIVFLTTWAGGALMAPFGPRTLDIHWLPFLLTGLIVSLVIGAVLPPRPASAGETAREAAWRAASLFFWLLMAALALVLLWHYAP
ncbi:MAG TPA: hypothetical protein VLW45_05640 [Pelomicrobium sp.]|nr:hypothetical protein [Pelomicrobium sp.]